MSHMKHKYLVLIVLGMLLGVFVADLEAQRPTRQRSNTARPARGARQQRPQPRPQKRAQPSKRARTAVRTPQRRPQERPRPQRRPTPKIRTRTPATQRRQTPKVRTPTVKRRANKRVPSVKRYQGSRSTRTRQGSSSHRTTGTARRAEPTRRPTPRVETRRTKTPTRASTNRSSHEATPRRRNSGRARLAQPSRLSKDNTRRREAQNSRNKRGVELSPVRRKSGIATKKGSASAPSRGFGSTNAGRRRTNQGANRAPTPRMNNRGQVRKNSRTASPRRSNTIDTPRVRGLERKPPATRNSKRTLSTKRNLGRGGFAPANSRDRGKVNTALRANRRPTTLRRLDVSQRSGIERPLAPVPERRLAPAPAHGARRADVGSRSHRGRSSYRYNDHNSSLNFGLFVGGGGWGLGLGYANNSYYNSGGASVTFGFGGGYGYANSYLHSTNYAPYWQSYYYGFGPGYVNVGDPGYGYFGHRVGFYSRARFHFGFNYYYPFAAYTPYPFYRTSYYEPWYVNRYARRTPAYRTYYYVQDPDPIGYSSYVETADPFYDEEDVFSATEIETIGYEAPYVSDAVVPVLNRDPTPVAFQQSFSNNVPGGLSYDESLAWAEEALFNGDYLSAAETFRRAMLLRPEDHYPKFQLALALFGAERYDLSYLALELGLDQNPSWIYRRFDVRNAFASEEEFANRLSALERYLIRHSNNDDARFVLGYNYFFSGNLFGARSVTRVLESSPRSFPHLKALAAESEKRLLRQR